MRKKNTFNVSLKLSFINLFSKILTVVVRPMDKVLVLLGPKKYVLDFKNRQDDIYIASFMGSGIEWLVMILHQLTSRGNITFKSIHEISPYLERSAQKNVDLGLLPSPRLIRTHAPYKFLPKKTEGRFIYLMRDGREEAVSLYQHYKRRREQLQFDRFFTNYFLKKKVWFVHLAQWLSNKSKFNILYIKYEDLRDDPEGTIEKLINFCNLEIDEFLLPKILEKCRLDYFLKHQRQFAPNDNLTVYQNQGQASRYFNENHRRLYTGVFNEVLSTFDLDCYNRN